MDPNIQDQNNSQIKNYIEKYNELLDQLKTVFQNNEQHLVYINKLLDEDDVNKWNRGLNLSSSIQTQAHFNYLLKGKIKVFSSKNRETYKISTSLFGQQLPLKKLFNNRSAETKKSMELFTLNYFICRNHQQNNDKLVKFEIFRIIR